MDFNGIFLDQTVQSRQSNTPLYLHQHTTSPNISLLHPLFLLQNKDNTMAATPSPTSRLHAMIQSSVQELQWTYGVFWQFSSHQGVLVWCDGYYNGAIKTRKTVHPMEVTAEEASLQRSQQLRELYESLSAGEANQNLRRPCASLSPEDLTESEWFYLMCVSFSFPPGIGLPGKAYVNRRHVWLSGANEVESKVFSRAILAKSARIQTVFCIPLLDGVVEFGSTDWVEEDIGIIHHVKTFFHDINHNPSPNTTNNNSALSEHSTSNPAFSSSSPIIDTALHKPSPQLYFKPSIDHNLENNEEDEEDDKNQDDDEEEDDEEEEEDDGNFESEVAAAIGRSPLLQETGEVSELMQIELSEGIRLGSPDDISNNLDSNFHIQNKTPPTIVDELHQQMDEYNIPLDTVLHFPGNQSTHEFILPEEEDSHYSNTVSSVLQNQSERRPFYKGNPSIQNISLFSSQTSFSKWTTSSDNHLAVPVDETSQWLLKYALFTIPFLHSKSRTEQTSPTPYTPRLRRAAAQEEVSANHVMAERRRREKLNERFIILRSLVPFVTKMDKASILGDTIEYVKQLRRKIEELERQRGGAGGKKMKGKRWGERSVEVSIIERDALLEIRCHYREGLMLDIMQMLRELKVETTTVQSSVVEGVFMAEVRANVKESVGGKKTSIMEVKRVINQIIPSSS